MSTWQFNDRSQYALCKKPFYVKEGQEYGFLTQFSQFSQDQTNINCKTDQNVNRNNHFRCVKKVCYSIRYRCEIVLSNNV